MAKLKKLHLGCGSVYLDGYLNVDVSGPHIALAADRPDLVEQLRTTEDRYYARHEDQTIEKLRSGASRVFGVCDQYFDAVQDEPFELDGHDFKIEELLARQVFEHFSLREAKRVLIVAWLCMAEDGLLRLDVPDVEETARLLAETKDPFYIRHLYGSRKDEYGYHLMGYTRDGLKALCASQGFEYLDEEPNIHYYPAFCLRFRRTL